ncbi:MAG: ABC transporter permease [Chloroflexi bacterium]|nr:ABC transporter permease [Chloroflexota bacterium]MCC6893879.1 ABC transporter permease [Anaerolineae bacterium]
MNILTTYTLKYLRLNKKRTAVTILGAVLSSALICGVLLLGLSFQKMMIDHEIFMSGSWHARFLAVPFEKAKYITENNAVETSMFSSWLGNATYGSQNTVRPYLYITAYDTLSFQNRNIKLITGRYPQNADELLVSPVMIGDSGLGLKVGSTVAVTFGQRDIPNHDEMVKAWGGEEYVALADGETFIPSVSKTYTVVGLMVPLADETSMPASFPALTYLDPAQLAAADKMDISILAHDPHSIYSSAPQMAESIGLATITGPDGQPTESIVYNEDLLSWMGASSHDNYARFFPVILATLIILIVCGSAFVIYNAFAISIGDRKKQFGMFASVGATSAQIRRIVLIEAGVIAAIAIPLGIVGAIIGVAILLKLTQGIVAQVILDAEQGMPLVVSPLVIVLTVLFSAVTIVLSAWVPARRAARVSPIDAIRQSGEVEEGKLLDLRTNPLIRRMFGFEGELALKSLKRDQKRYRTTVLSLMISIILFVAFNSLTLYTNTTQNIAVQAMNFDLMIDLDYRQTHAEDFAERVVQLPEVQRVTFRRSHYSEYIPERSVITDPAYQALQELTSLDNQYLPTVREDGTYEFVLEVNAVGPTEFAHYAGQLGLDLAQYSDPSKPLAILVNHITLRQSGKLYDFDLFNLKPGDTITANRMQGWPSPQTGGDAIDSLTWTVGTVTEETPLGFMGMTLTPTLFVSDAVFDSLSDQMVQLGPINPGNMTLKSDDPDTALVAIERLYKSTVGGNFSYQSMKEFNQSNSLQTLLTNLFFYGFMTLITLIGVTNIVNTLDTSIKLRRREFAMLKSVGLTPAGFRRMLRYESLFYGLTALLYGLPIAIAVSVFIYSQFGSGVGTFNFTLPWGAIAACIIGILAIVFVTMMISGATIRNDNIVDTIKEQNL